MKKIFAVLLLLSLLSPFALKMNATANESNIEILANKKTILLDDTLVVTIKIKQCNCQSVNFKITWDSSNLFLNEITVKGFLIENCVHSPTSASTIEIARSTNSFGIGYTSLKADDLTFNEFEIAVLKFSVKSTGTFTFNVSEDSAGNDAFYTKFSQKLSINCVNCLHENGFYINNEKSPSCTKEGYSGDKYCNNCNELLQAGNIITKTEHIGGIATCCELARCSICGQSYGEYNPLNHSGMTEIRNQIEPTYDKEGFSGDTYCSDCGELLNKGEIIPKLSDTKNEPENNKDNNQSNNNINNQDIKINNWIKASIIVIIPFLIFVIGLLIYIIIRKQNN